MNIRKAHFAKVKEVLLEEDARVRLAVASRTIATYCDHCQKQTVFLAIQFAALLANVTRQTIYNWMDRGWLHWRARGGGRMVCLQSLMEAHKVDARLLSVLTAGGKSNSQSNSTKV